MVDNLTSWDASQCTLSPEQRITSLIMNTLEERSRLYKMESYMNQKDVEKLFGDDIRADDFNDDALGRALDTLYEAGPAKLFGSVVSRVLIDEVLRINSLHGDTTSVPVQGEFPDAAQESLNITYEHSKDNHPDLKQFKYGLIVTPDGVPVESTVDGGNESDKTWNYELLERLGKNLPDQQEMPVYVGDSQLPTKKNLERMDRMDIDFISRLPGTYKLHEQLKREAVTDWEFEQVGTVSDREWSATYRICSFYRELYGNRYRFLVVHSSSLTDQKEGAVDHELSEIREGFRKTNRSLKGRSLPAVRTVSKHWRRSWNNMSHRFLKSPATSSKRRNSRSEMARGDRQRIGNPNTRPSTGSKLRSTRRREPASSNRKWTAVLC